MSLLLMEILPEAKSGSALNSYFLGNQNSGKASSAYLYRTVTKIVTAGMPTIEVSAILR